MIRAKKFPLEDAFPAYIKTSVRIQKPRLIFLYDAGSQAQVIARIVWIIYFRHVLYKNFIHITPCEFFARRNRFHDGMAGRLEVFGRVPIFGIIAAANMPAGKAHTQTDPGIPYFYAIFTNGNVLRMNVPYLILVGADFLTGHGSYYSRA